MKFELHNSYSSPDTIKVIRPRRMRWVGHVTHMGEMKKLHKKF